VGAGLAPIGEDEIARAVAAGDLPALGRRLRREPIWTAGAATRAVSHHRDAIERLIEHRDPFLLLDRLTLADPPLGALEGTRRLDPEDPVFRGHFPGDPVYPGALQIETIAQLSLCCFHFLAGQTYEIPLNARPRRFRGLQVHHAAFLLPQRPGDELTVRARVLASDSLTMTCAGQLLQGGRIGAVAIIDAYFVDGD
jgi:3-hydroxymyristoyl/3-hydroxydecanoyl-(acyl carrier protein) dehydratase